MADAKPRPVPPDLPAPPGATHYLEQFSDTDGKRAQEPVPGGTVTIDYYNRAGNLVATTHGTVT